MNTNQHKFPSFEWLRMLQYLSLCRLWFQICCVQLVCIQRPVKTEMIFWNAFVSIHNYGFQIWLINQMETINGIKMCCIENVSMESTVIDYIIMLWFLFRWHFVPQLSLNVFSAKDIIVTFCQICCNITIRSSFYSCENNSVCFYWNQVQTS